MTKSEENLLTMIESTQSLLDENVQKLTSAALSQAVIDLDGIVLKVNEKMREINTITAGKAQTKAGAEDKVLSELMVVSKALLAYGYVADDAEIIEKARMTESQLRHTRDTEFVGKARTVHELAEERVAELADYGITEEIVASLKTRIDAFEKALGDRESSVARRKGARSSFYDYLDQAKDLLENLIDNLMEPYKKSDPEFYNSYAEARVVKDIGIRHKAEAEQPAEAK